MRLITASPVMSTLPEKRCCLIAKAKEYEKTAPAGKGYRVFSVIRSVLVYLLAAAVIIGALLFAADRSPGKSLFGLRYYTVLTDSMVPEFSKGDVVIVKVTKAEDIQVGDIITFNPSSGSDAYLTHRVTEKLTDYQGTGVTCFRTKGDANDTADNFLIDETRVIGRVKLHIPKLGTALRFIQLRWYFIVPLIIMLFVFIELMRHYFELKNASADNAEGPEAQTNENDSEKEL